MNAVRKWLLCAVLLVFILLSLVGHYPELFGLSSAESARPFPGIVEPPK